MTTQPGDPPAPPGTLGEAAEARAPLGPARHRRVLALAVALEVRAGAERTTGHPSQIVEPGTLRSPGGILKASHARRHAQKARVRRGAA